MDLIRPDLADHVEKQQRAQKQYADRGSRTVSVQKGDAVWVTSVDRLQGVNGRTWLPGVVLDVCSVKVTVMLMDGRVICRHVDHVRRRETVSGAPPHDNREGEVFDDVFAPERPAAGGERRAENDVRAPLALPAPDDVGDVRRAENRTLRPRPTAEPDRYVAVWSNTGVAP